MPRGASVDLNVNGAVVRATVVTDPTVDDVVVSEARLQAREIQNVTVPSDRRVDRSMREYLVRFGVLR